MMYGDLISLTSPLPLLQQSPCVKLQCFFTFSHKSYHMSLFVSSAVLILVLMKLENQY